MKRLLNFLTSIKLAIVLLIIIICASILGTLIPQDRSHTEYAARYGQLSVLFERLQLTNLYHSFWYIALLVLLALNITVCTLERLLSKLRRTFHPRFETEAKNLMALQINDKFRIGSDFEAARAEVKQEMSRHHYILREKQGQNRIFILSRKRVLGWFGSDFVHLGLLIILAGGIASGIGGFKTSLTFRETQTLPVPKADFFLRLDKFTTLYYPNGAVKDWKSTLAVLEGDQARLRKTIEVNDPLSHKGFVFYQSGYGWDWENPTLEIQVKKKNDPSFLKIIEIKVGERRSLPDSNLQMAVSQFLPDFVLNENNKPASRSAEPNNPAAFIEGWEGETKLFSGWVFAKFPDFAQIHSAKETNLSFELKDFKAAQYSVIQMARDPGVNLIWIGCVTLMTGLFLAFYWPAREIKLILEEIQGKTEAYAGGIASKNREEFRLEFENIIALLRKRK